MEERKWGALTTKKKVVRATNAYTHTHDRLLHTHTRAHYIITATSVRANRGMGRRETGVTYGDKGRTEGSMFSFALSARNNAHECILNTRRPRPLSSTYSEK